jgi:NTP pyrophosphatase (non-canonical NTP hydrolase)
MNPQEYHVLAMRTKSHDQTPVQRLTNAALGLAGEFAEIVYLSGPGQESEALKECGDLLWYVIQGCDALGLDSTEVIENSARTADLTSLIGAIGGIAEIAKKAMFHGHISTAEQHIEVENCLTVVVGGIKMVLELHGWTLEQAMQANIDKLRRRYPDGFSAEASINREDAVYDE